VNTEKLYQKFLSSSGVTTDSRNCPEGSVFFALKGDNFDGNKFAHEAISKGCRFAVIDDPAYENDACILVKDSLKTLQELAVYHRKNSSCRIIALTGSNGKTTTKELIRSVLEKSYRVIATEGNLNNHIGVPLTLLRIKEETDIAVVEMGANHQGEIAQLTDIASPDMGLITNIGKAHLEGFGSYEGIISAKSELYRGMDQPDKILFVNKDNPLLVNLSDSVCAEKYYYGTGNDAQTVGKTLQSHPFLKISFRNITQDQYIETTTNLVGSYNFENVLAAVSIGQYLKIPDALIADAISRYYPTNNRSQLVETAKNTVVNDFYNANPSSMEVALLNFSKENSANKCVILGDMLELGVYAEQEHRKIVALLDQLSLPYFLIGPVFSEITGESENVFQSTDDFVEWIANHPIENKSILIKGSRGIRLEKIVSFL
jgi:UDP-N-acetylmuramoyl-tripeptide--D-alanyl-D-alanine ligase